MSDTRETLVDQLTEATDYDQLLLVSAKFAIVERHPGE